MTSDAVFYINFVVDGGWTEWKYELPCSVSCGVGEETFTRNCSNPEPKCGGKACVGSDTLSKICDTKKPCPCKLNEINNHNCLKRMISHPLKVTILLSH